MAPEHNPPGETPNDETPDTPPPIHRGEPKPYEPTEADITAYKDFEAELFKREVSNAEAYDKAVMMYSTGALGLSLTFIKDILPPGKAVHMWSLYWSWIAFLISLIVVLASYMVGQIAIRKQRDLAHEYYLEGKEEKMQSKYNPWSKWTDYLNVGSGLFFVFGAALMVFFVSKNVALRETPSPDIHAAAPKTSQSTAPTSVQSPPITQTCAPVIVMQPPTQAPVVDNNASRSVSLTAKSTSTVKARSHSSQGGGGCMSRENLDEGVVPQKILPRPPSPAPAPANPAPAPVKKG